MHEKNFSVVVPIGVVTLMSIGGNIPRESLDLAEVEIPLQSPNASSDSITISPSTFTGSDDMRIPAQTAVAIVIVCPIALI